MSSARLEVEEVAGDWEALRALTGRIEETVAANLDTPCVRNSRSLLVCAAGWLYAGDETRASRPESAAGELGMEGYHEAMAAPLIRLELARGRHDRLADLLEHAIGRAGLFFPATATARLDALLALGDRARLEQEARSLLRPGTLFEPFALRALGVVREDEELVARAAERFDAMGLDWHAAQTRELVGEA